MKALLATGLALASLMRTPDGGIQPQAAVDEAGAVHLIYFKGDPGGGDIFYVRRGARDRDFSGPVRVNSGPGSAIATGTVRGAHIAVGAKGRVHVAWMGSKQAEPRGPGGATPMLYTRSNEQGNGFEPQRNVLQIATGLDGGASVAADRSGNVYVAWHANYPLQGEENRRVWMARSSDGGKTFAREAPAYTEPTGACACCGMRAFADRNGAVYMLYRSAVERVHRDIYLLFSRDPAKGFQGLDIHKWKINACPMSTASIAEGGRGVLVAWETAGQVYYAEVERETFKIGDPVPAPGNGKGRKHPAIAGNARGEKVLVWTEGTGWQRGGSLAWQVFDKANRPTGGKGDAPGVPPWGLGAVFAGPDGGFTIVY